MMALRTMWYSILLVVCVVIIGATGLVAFWVTDRALPVEVLDTEVVTPEVEPGGKLVIRQTVKYLRDCGAHADRTLWDDHTNRQWLMDIDYEKPPDGLGERPITFKVDVPFHFRPGKGRYQSAPIFWCNPIQKYFWPIDREPTVVWFRIK